MWELAVRQPKPDEESRCKQRPSSSKGGGGVVFIARDILCGMIKKVVGMASRSIPMFQSDQDDAKAIYEYSIVNAVLSRACNRNLKPKKTCSLEYDAKRMGH